LSLAWKLCSMYRNGIGLGQVRPLELARGGRPQGLEAKVEARTDFLSPNYWEPPTCSLCAPPHGADARGANWESRPSLLISASASRSCVKLLKVGPL